MAKKDKKKNKKKLSVKKVSFFWIYVFLGIIAILVSLLIAPFWKVISTELEIKPFPWQNWGDTLLGFLLAILIFIYIFTILIYKLRNKKQHKVVRILTAVEFSFMVVISVCCILYSIYLLSNPVPDEITGKDYFSRIIVGLAIYIRGFVELFGAYYYDKNNQNLKPYPVWYLLINIFLITIGTMFFFFTALTDTLVLYIFAVCLLMGGVLLIIYGFLAKPCRIVEPVEDPSLKEKIDHQNATTSSNETNKNIISKPMLQNEPIEYGTELKAIDTSKIESTMLESEKVKEIENKEVKEIEHNIKETSDEDVIEIK